MKCYSELILLPTLVERYEYLRCAQRVGERTFGGNRYFNQAFYKSREWINLRHKIIVRDNGCDLGLDGYPVGSRGYVHHINPITMDQLTHGEDCLFDPENLILCSFNTHNAIHYGDKSLLPSDPVVRRPNDTCPWK